MTRRLIVFRLDRNPLICRRRIRNLRRLNPGVSIVGLYGGQGGYRRAAFRIGSRLVLGLDSFHASKRSGHWNWQHGDLALLDWYRRTGRRLDFDVAYFLEWDLLLLGPLSEVYERVPSHAVGLTAPTLVADIDPAWDWLKLADLRAGTDALFAIARSQWAFTGEPRACLGVGPCFPRAFLDAYADLEPPETGHDELRLPLFADILGFPIVNTGFRRGWSTVEDDEFFNATGQDITASSVIAEAARDAGRRAFHPVRQLVAGLE